MAAGLIVDDHHSNSPLRAIMNIRRTELPFALLMFAYFFLVITTFWILKPIKKSLFIEYYDAAGCSLFTWTLNASQAELLAKVLNMVVAFLAVAAFTWLARRYRRQQLTFVFTAFFLASYVGYMPLLEHPRDLTVWSFYLFGDLFSTLMVATFFAFLNDSVTPDAAKRLYGLIGLGGVMGGVFGATGVRMFISALTNAQWLWVCAAIAVVILGVAFAAGRIVEGRSSLGPAVGPESTHDSSGSAAIEGARIVFRSPYLFSIVGIVGLYELVSTVMDFQFTSTVAHDLEGAAIGEQFSTVFAITNGFSMFVQLFLTSFVMTRFGVGMALLVLPIAALSGSVGFMALPVLWMGSALNTIDNAFSYSINQSAKEALYVPTTKDEKYKAKAFIDMFVQRFAKAIAVGVSLVITRTFSEFSSIRWLSLFTVAVVAVWIVAARYAGRYFSRVTEYQKQSS